MSAKNIFKRSMTLILAVSLMLFAPVSLPGTECTGSKSSGAGMVSKASAAKKFDKKDLGAKTAVLMDVNTGTVLFSKKPHKHMYPASITKIMTTYLSIINSSPDEDVVFNKNTAFGTSPYLQWDASNIGAKPGEKIPMRDCWYAMMLQSANEVCLGAAEHVGGTIENFVNMMNEEVSRLGLSDTHFNNPNGLHDPDHYTSAYDMAVIASAAYKNDEFRNVTGTKSYVIPKTNKEKKRPIVNHHSMLSGSKFPQYAYKYCTGGKTGYTNAAQYTLVTFAEKDDMQLVCVVMGDRNPQVDHKNEYSDSIKLLNYGFNNFEMKQVGGTGADLNESRSDDGLFTEFSKYLDPAKSPLDSEQGGAVILPKGADMSLLTRETEVFTSPVTLSAAQMAIGRATYKYMGETVGSTYITYDESKSPKVSLTDLLEGKNNASLSAKKKNPLSRTVNNIRFTFMTASGNVHSFFKGRIALLILLVLILLMMILMIVNYREVLNSHGSRKYALRDKNKDNSASMMEGSLSFGGGKRRRRKRGYSLSSSTSFLEQESGSLNFKSDDKRRRKRKKTQQRVDRDSMMRERAPLHFSAKHNVKSISFGKDLGSVEPEGHKKTRASGVTDERLRPERNISDGLEGMDLTSRKSRRRHRKTTESFGTNYYYYKNKNNNSRHK
ncbi:MAG: D-alanyl-D-alanine carboxypeptidase family protein [Lachnospiraceae bacterium]|jgi:D-alanyl-D-alanine carboxypeptidase (penicillin-binding protein 5/6)|nr:D-alanyl-D-alanine carboxypeptidase family protein [Lachnospiraceae bacterium]MEE3460340.1 D-alanyl-D-alanine carboxypeptidase family protein [Lachnospiraceae bacterium]